MADSCATTATRVGSLLIGIGPARKLVEVVADPGQLPGPLALDGGSRRRPGPGPHHGPAQQLGQRHAGRPRLAAPLGQLGGRHPHRGCRLSHHRGIRHWRGGRGRGDWGARGELPRVGGSKGPEPLASPNVLRWVGWLSFITRCGPAPLSPPRNLLHRFQSCRSNSNGMSRGRLSQGPGLGQVTDYSDTYGRNRMPVDRMGGPWKHALTSAEKRSLASLIRRGRGKSVLSLV